MPLSIAEGCFRKDLWLQWQKKGWLAAGNITTHLMLWICCYSWFVKCTWRVSYCSGNGREKLSWDCSETNVPPLQGHLPGVALFFQDSSLKEKVLGQYCWTSVFLKASWRVRCQINKTGAGHMSSASVSPVWKLGRQAQLGLQSAKVQDLFKGKKEVYQIPRTHPPHGAQQLSDISDLTI